MRRLALLLLIPLASAGARQAPRQGQAVPTFRTASQLVVQVVTVLDRDGRPMEGLTARDFLVSEDGVPQSIGVFEFQKLPQDAEAVPLPAPVREAKAEPRVEPVTGVQIKPAVPGDTRFRDRRLLVLYFDTTSMPVPDQLRALTAADRFIRTRMTPVDVAAIMQFEGGAVKVLQDFTADRDLLLTAIARLIAIDEGLGENDSDPGAAFGQDDAEFNLFNTDRQLSALQTAASMLGTHREKKALVYFASGLRLNGTDNQAQLRATLNAAIRANVSIYPVDARGLIAGAPLGDATRGSSGGAEMYTGGAAVAIASDLQRSQDTLYALASDTGGKATFDYNDLTMGIVQAQKAIDSYYIIGYYSTNAALDGKFRRVRISLREIEGAKLDYRQGYFAGKEFSKFTAADKERQLEEALMLENPITDLTIAMEVNHFQLNRAEYFVPVVMKIPGSELALARRRGAERTVIDFIGEIKNEHGTTIQNIRDKVDIRLSGETAAELAKRPIEYDTGYTLLPGSYTIKVLARDAETGRIGTYLTRFVVPNLNKEEKRIPISSVVLGSRRAALREALYTAGRDKEQAANPLVQDGQKLIPSVTRFFSRTRDLYVYLQAYQQGVESAQPLLAYLTFYRGGVKAFETPPLAASEAMNNRLKTIPLRMSVDLNNLATGRYTCQVTVLEPASKKAAFWQAPIVVMP